LHREGNGRDESIEFRENVLFLPGFLLIGGASLSCKGGTSSSEGDSDAEESTLEVDFEQTGDPDTVDRGDLVEPDDKDPIADEDPSDSDVVSDLTDTDPLGEEDRPIDQTEDLEEDLADPPAEEDTAEQESSETEQPDPTTLWMIFEGFVSGGGHAASSQYKLQYGRVGGAVASGVAQSTHYRISDGGVSER
jgi:hypothetical protein